MLASMEFIYHKYSIIMKFEKQILNFKILGKYNINSHGGKQTYFK